ncbi:MAG: CRTAC1 family protein [Planctomycetota bacterium]
MHSSQVLVVLVAFWVTLFASGCHRDEPKQTQKPAAVAEARVDSASREMDPLTRWRKLNQEGLRQEASSLADRLVLNRSFNAELLSSLLIRSRPFPLMEPRSAASSGANTSLARAQWEIFKKRYRTALEQIETAKEVCRNDVQIDSVTREKQLDLLQSLQAFCHAQLQLPIEVWLDIEERPACLSYVEGVMALSHVTTELARRDWTVDLLLHALAIDPTRRLALLQLHSVILDDNPEVALEAQNRASLIFQWQDLLQELEPWESMPLERRRQIFSKMAKDFFVLGRPFESLGAAMLVADRAQMNRLARDWQSLASQPDLKDLLIEETLMGLRPSKSVGDIFKELQAEWLKRGDLALAGGTSQAEMSELDRSGDGLIWKDLTKSLGLDFTYLHRPDGDLAHMALRESLGGGIAIADFDLDGWPDLSLAQGDALPIDYGSESKSVLLHNVSGSLFDVTRQSGFDIDRYTTGITVGDVNQDGFPDFFFCSFGRLSLWINQGDGTFEDQTSLLGKQLPMIPTSAAMADWTGDGLPEIYVAKYIDWEQAAEPLTRGPDGFYVDTGPLQFIPQPDVWFESGNDGAFRSRLVDPDTIEPGTGLGIVVGDFDEDRQLELLIGNDGRSNHLLEASVDGSRVPFFVDRAVSTGIAHNFDGVPTASMGIAPADFNGDGLVDFQIANFSGEPASLYIQRKGSGFTDQANRYDLSRPTTSAVGFGTKAYDFDRDGDEDLLTLNGHISDRRHRGESFQMKPQLLWRRGDQFVEAEAKAHPFFESPILGRSLAVGDLNRDGWLDMVVGAIGTPYQVISGISADRGYPSLVRLYLSATNTERSAIGATIESSIGQKRWQTSGCGYLSHDESVVDLLASDPSMPDQDGVLNVKITWPSGKVQSFTGLRGGSEYRIIENEEDAFLLR